MMPVPTCNYYLAHDCAKAAVCRILAHGRTYDMCAIAWRIEARTDDSTPLVLAVYDAGS